MIFEKKILFLHQTVDWYGFFITSLEPLTIPRYTDKKKFSNYIIPSKVLTLQVTV